MIKIIPPIQHLVFLHEHSTTISFGGKNTRRTGIRELVMGGQGKKLGTNRHHVVEEVGRNGMIEEVEESGEGASVAEMVDEGGARQGKIDEREMVREGIVGDGGTVCGRPDVSWRDVGDATFSQALHCLMLGSCHHSSYTL